MASTYQTNRAVAGSSGGSGGSSNPYVQSVIVGDWNTSSVPGVASTGSVDFRPINPYFQFITGSEFISIGGESFPVFAFLDDPFIGTDYYWDVGTLANDINNVSTGSSFVTATVTYGSAPFGDILNLTAKTEGVAGDSIAISAGNFIQSPTITSMSGGVDPVSDSDYTLTISEATHEKGTDPTVTLYEENGGIFEEVEAYVAINATGDITIKVPVNPDGRFIGKIVVN